MPRTDLQTLQERKDFLQTVSECAETPSKFSEIFLDHEVFDYNK